MARKAILEHQAVTSLCPEDLNSIVDATVGYTGAELVHLCQEASFNAISLKRQQVCIDDFRSILSVSQPRIRETEIAYYASFAGNA